MRIGVRGIACSLVVYAVPIKRRPAGESHALARHVKSRRTTESGGTRCFHASTTAPNSERTMPMIKGVRTKLAVKIMIRIGNASGRPKPRSEERRVGKDGGEGWCA